MGCFPSRSQAKRKLAQQHHQRLLAKYFDLAHLQRVLRQIATMASEPTENAPKLNFELHPATDDDFDFFMEPLFGVMGRAAFVSALWPDNQTELGRKRAKERWLKEM